MKRTPGTRPSSPCLMQIGLIQILFAAVWFVLFANSMVGAQTETVLYSFTGKSDGSLPYGSLVLDAQGNVYGTTFEGGATCNFQLYTCGTVFEVTPAGTETAVHAFVGGTRDGYWPWAGLTRDRKGNLYGTTYSGGTHGAGTVFAVPSTGASRLLYSFTGLADGGNPYASLIQDRQGNLYGTTFYGGSGRGCSTGNGGCGTVFKVTPAGTETVLYNFAGAPDGAFPVGGLIRDAQGNFYGTTSFGGGGGAFGGCGIATGGCGTVFKLTPAGTETVLYTFTGGTDGGTPESGLVMDAQGNLYGTAFQGGAVSCGCGTVFKVTPSGTETVLHTFTGGADGVQPHGTLIRDSKGNLYGTTFYGGNPNVSYGPGTVFKVTADGSESILYNFSAPGDGFGPIAGLVMDAQGNLYGTTEYGGAYGSGTVFKVVP